MNNMPFAIPDITEEEVEAVAECLRSGWVTTGKKTQEFETQFAEAIGVKHALAMNSATSAALVIMDAMGIGPGDEVIIPAYTFSGPAMMARHLGAKVVLADSYPDSPLMSIWNVMKLVTSRTKAIMPTHFAGIPYGLNGDTHILDVPVIHDAAHAFPTTYQDGSMVGSKGLATFFSFYATKCLTTGEGGMITTNDDALADRIRKLRIHGFNRTVFDRYTNPAAGWKYDIAEAGWKANMTDLSAALGLVQLKRSSAMRDSRAAVSKAYDAAFTESGIPYLEHDENSAYHLYQIYVREEVRDEFIVRMSEEGIQCSVHFIPLHLHTAWQAVGVNVCPYAEDIYNKTVSLPVFSKMTGDDAQRVIDAVRKVYAEVEPCSQD